MTTYEEVSTIEKVPVGEYEEIHEEDVLEDVYEDRQIEVTEPITYSTRTVPAVRCDCNDESALVISTVSRVGCQCIGCRCEFCNSSGKYSIFDETFYSKRLLKLNFVFLALMIDAELFLLFSHYGFEYLGAAVAVILLLCPVCISLCIWRARSSGKEKIIYRDSSIAYFQI